MKNHQETVSIFAIGEITTQRDYALANIGIQVPINSKMESWELVDGFGHARRDGGDKADRAVGYDLAIARALYDLANKLERRANGLILNLDNEKDHRRQIGLMKAAGEWNKNPVKKKKKASKKTKKRVKALAK